MATTAAILRMVDDRGLITAAEVSSALESSNATAAIQLLRLMNSGILLRRPIYLAVKGKGTFIYWRRGNFEPTAFANENFSPAMKILVFLQQRDSACVKEILPVLRGVSRIALHYQLTNLCSLGLIRAETDKLDKRRGAHRRYLYQWQKNWAEDEGNELPQDVVRLKDPASCLKLLRLLKHKGVMSLKELLREFGAELTSQKLRDIGHSLEIIGLVELVWIEESSTRKAGIGYQLAKVLQTNEFPINRAVA